MTTRVVSSNRRVIAPLIAALVGFIPQLVLAQVRDGAIAGRIVDTSGAGIYGASVRLADASTVSVTDPSGAFHLDRVPSGSYTVHVYALGYAPESSQVMVEPGRTTIFDLRLKPAPLLLSAVSVRAQRMGETESAALARQQSAANVITVLSGDQIRALPNANAAEAAGRIPGVSIERDEGEGKFVQIRGTEPRLSNVTIDGSHVPGTETDRIPKLDNVPADLLGAIEVSKTLTADMDADAIGGSVNLLTKIPEGPPRGYISGQFGHITLLDHTTGQGGLTYGGRIGEGQKFGFLLGGSIDRFNRVINDVEPAWAVDGTGRSYPVEWSQRDYTYYRDRYGVGGDVDYRLSDRSTLYVKGLWSMFLNHGTRYVYDISTNGDSGAAGPIGYGQAPSLTREVSQRTPTEQMWGVTAGGRHDLGGAILDYSANLAGTRQSVTGYHYSDFSYTGAPGLTVRYDASNITIPTYRYLTSPEVSAAQDPTNFTLAGYENNDGLTTGSDVGGAVNVLVPYRWGDRNAAFKFGVRVRDESKRYLSEDAVFGATGTPFLLSQALTGFSDPGYYSAISSAYQPLGPLPDPRAATTFENGNPGAFTNQTDSVGNALASFSGSERIYAGYLMNEADFGALHVNLGLRVERTHSEYTGHAADSLGAVSAVPGSESYTDVFPSAQLRYAVNQNTDVRFAVTRAIARPNYPDLAPSLQGTLGAIYQHDYTNLSAGNPNLRPEHAWNLDLLAEHFFPSVGVVYAGVFYKSLSDVILTRNFIYNGPYAPFDGYYGTEPANGGAGHVAGIELTWSDHLTSLPGILNGLGFDVNYTHTSSSVVVDASGRKAPLLRQAPDLANVAITYDRGAISSRIAWEYNGPNITSYGDGSATANGDNYFYAHSQIDGSVIVTMVSRVQVQFQVLNINNAVFGFFNGTPNHAYNVQREYYGQTFYLGMKYGL